jgi:phage-related tail fiber protein
MTTLDIRGTVVGETAVAIKAPCLVATVGTNIVLAGVQMIDGVTVGNGSDRVLVKDQIDQTQNGIYVAGAAAWVLAADWQGNTNVVCGTMVMVAGGAVNAGILFVQTCSDSPIVIGVSDIVFVNAATVSGLSQTATSTTTLTIGVGSRTLAIAANKNITVGQWVLIQETANPANQMLGQVTSCSGSSLAVNVVAIAGRAFIRTGPSC